MQWAWKLKKQKNKRQNEKKHEKSKDKMMKKKNIIILTLLVIIIVVSTIFISLKSNKDYLSKIDNLIPQNIKNLPKKVFFTMFLEYFQKCQTGSKSILLKLFAVFDDRHNKIWIS